VEAPTRWAKVGDHIADGAAHTALGHGVES
jgi:hypothetical protein